MDLKLMLKAVEIIFPQVSKALSWTRRHIKQYNITCRDNEIHITIIVDSNENTKQAKEQLEKILEAITN